MKIIGKVATIIFKNDKNNWTVLLLKQNSDFITCVGETDEIEVDDEIELEGDMVTHKVYGEQFKFIQDNLELLQTVFIISALDVKENERKDEIKLGVKVEQAPGEKCERCWMYSETVGQDKENPTICHRCSEAIK